MLSDTDSKHGARCAPTTAALAAAWDGLGAHGTAFRRAVRGKGALADALGVRPPRGSVSAASAGAWGGLEGCGRAVCLERGTPLSSVVHWHQRFVPANEPNNTDAVS